ncbi:MAG TPA: Rab family GTPase [Candidatus Lokiarchaeia archaeon]|nr:Rab family GTPase [Candidatus Lokiarchaeia archaeon]
MRGTNYIFKVVVGGAGGVGKTTLLHRYLHNEFLTDTSMTIGVNFLNKELIRDDGTKIVLTLWDLGGQERFRFFQPSCCMGSKAAIVFFDMTRLDTSIQVKEWVDMFRTNGSPTIPIILGGTKLDLATPDLIDGINEYANKLVDQFGLANYIPTSSKTGENIEETFNFIVDLLLQQVGQESVASVPSME